MSLDLQKKDFVIGVLGGMGTYATIHLFEQYAKLFPAEKEWDRPRIIIDNRCTMPSRVRAFLYEEKVDTLISEMTDSIKRLIDAGCTRILLACNTSHLFLPQIFEHCPGAEKYIVNIIDACVDKVIADASQDVFLLASEGTIESRVYQKCFEQRGWAGCHSPNENDYKVMRLCIEAVKQNHFSEEVRQQFCRMIDGHTSCILGCTELPILWEKYGADTECINVYDPVQISLEKLKQIYDHCK